MLRLRKVPLIHRSSYGPSNGPFGRKTHSRSSHTFISRRYPLAVTCGLVSVVSAGLVYVYSFRQVVQNEAIPPTSKEQLSVSGNITAPYASSNEDNSYSCLVWGTNKNSLLAPTGGPDHFKIPQPSRSMPETALRDVALHEEHAACIDARGDVYQWGLGFSKIPMKPVKTLSGKDAIQIVLTSSKAFALSAPGKIFCFSSAKDTQRKDNKASHPLGWLFSSDANVDFVQLATNVPLASGEKFISICTGADHLVALTSSGRVFSLPVSMQANSHGQLGFREVQVSLSSPSKAPFPLELNPIASRDPYATATPFRRTARDAMTSSIQMRAYPLNPPQEMVDDKSIRFCTILREVPSLRGVQVVQAAAGSRSTYIRTIGGQALAWGANEAGQLGLGANVTLPYVTAPTEISFARGASSGASSKCTSIAAGGDTAYFTVHRTGLENKSTFNEVLACGQGQWGSLGNGSFSSAQGDPIRMKAVSGLMEYNEKLAKTQALGIRDIAVSPTGHALLTFQSVAHAGFDPASGRDLLAWGLNRDYQLGNGRRTNLATPVPLQTGDGSRFMLKQKQGEVRDMDGRRWRNGAVVKQTAVAGYGCTVVYWKIVM